MSFRWLRQWAHPFSKSFSELSIMWVLTINRNFLDLWLPILFWWDGWVIFPEQRQHFVSLSVMFSQPHTETSPCLANRSVERVLSQLAQRISYTAVDLTSVEYFCWTKSPLISVLGFIAVLMPVVFIDSSSKFFLFLIVDSCSLWK